MAQNKSLTVSFFGRDVTLNKTLDGIKKNTFATSNVLEQASKKATYVLGALGAAAIKFAKAAAEDEKAAMSLASTLKTVVGASEAQIAQVEKFISKTEDFAAVADDKLRPAFDTLVRSTGNVAKSQKFLSTALEISAKTGVDVETVANAISKASRGQLRSLAAITKIAPKTTSTQKQYANSLKVVNGQIVTVTKAMTVGKKTTEDYESYLKRVNLSYKGSIAAISGTTSFKFQQFQVQLEKTQETLGAMLLPYMNDLLDWLVRISPWVEENKDAIMKWAKAIAIMAVSVKALNGAYKLFKITEAIAGFVTLGKTATATGATVASAGRVAALGWGWLALALVTFTGIYTIAKKLQQRRQAQLNDPSKLPAWSVESNKVWKDTEMRAAPKMAAGGIVTRRTTAIIGESGPEAVIPLNKGFGGGITIINNIQGSVVTEKEMSLRVRDDIAQLLRRKGLNTAILGV